MGGLIRRKRKDDDCMCQTAQKKYMYILDCKRELDIGNDFQLFVRYLVCVMTKKQIARAFEQKLTK